MDKAKVGLSGGKMSYRVHVVPRKKRRIMREPSDMKTPYGLEVIESCLTCPLTTERLFCHLSKPALEGLDAISSSATYPKGAILFVEGQEPRGVFILCNGRVKLSASSVDGKALILRIAEAGEVVGLPGTISGKAYEVTAEALEPIQANFVPRDPFLLFLKEHGEVALRVAEILSDIYHATYQEVRYLGLSGSAAGKLARFLLDRTEGQGATQGDKTAPIRAVLTLTHEEIAEMIGASRETVTRVFADFKRKRFVEVHGSTLIILDKLGLQKLIGA
jgi:CRP/FNR family transcriptional regulator, cyclic AMP receptor protein